MESLSMARVARRFNRKNPYAKEILDFLKQKIDDGMARNEVKLMLKLKQDDLLELVQRMVQLEFFPIVDKKTGLVMGLKTIGDHEYLVGLLERYYRVEEKRDDFIDLKNALIAYLDQGRGYYISSMYTDRIVVGVEYRPDEHDQRLFEVAKLKHEY